MNSWNRQESIANNVKLYKLGLKGDWTNVIKYLTDAADSGGLQDIIDGEMRAFDEKYYPNYRVGFNGRSNGYLVLYNGDNNRSVLPNCVSDYDSYKDFKEDVKAWYNGYRVSDFDCELREAVQVVRDFDKLCDTLRDIVNEYSTRNFDIDKLENAIDRFNLDYEDDLDDLGLEGPELEGDKIRLGDIRYYNAFMNCFFECFGDDRRRVDYDTTYLWLKES
jgi:uncharacterized protein YeeX (DUF496 family)